MIFIGEQTDSPLGNIHVAVRNGLLILVNVGYPLTLIYEQLDQKTTYSTEQITDDVPAETAPFLQAITQYLNGERRNFDLPLDWGMMSPFQAAALRQVCAIPYGETRTYGEIAMLVNKPKAARAVGRANATNPLPLIIPCHRVVGSQGKLGGYSGANGLETKKWLLRLEGYL